MTWASIQPFSSLTAATLAPRFSFFRFHRASRKAWRGQLWLGVWGGTAATCNSFFDAKEVSRPLFLI